LAESSQSAYDRHSALAEISQSHAAAQNAEPAILFVKYQFYLSFYLTICFPSQKNFFGILIEFNLIYRLCRFKQGVHRTNDPASVTASVTVINP
jgi:hypothetical protein